MKTIETLQTNEEEDETINITEDDELGLDTDQIDDLTVSTFGLKESSEILLETPTVPSMPQGEELPEPPSTQTVKPIIPIPTSEDYEAMWREAIDRVTAEVCFRDLQLKLKHFL